MHSGISQLGFSRISLEVQQENKMKILKYHEIFQIFLKKSREFLYGNWQYLSNIRTLSIAFFSVSVTFSYELCLFLQV
jgi:hypothetical protein